MAANISTISPSGGGQLAQPVMDKRLLTAAMCGDLVSMVEMTSDDPRVLLGTTPLQKNTCLHISSLHGHEVFCKEVVNLEESLLSNVNFEWETPLITAVTRGHASLASFLLRRCCELGLRQTIMQQDKDGYNALHHAVRSGHTNLALELIAQEPALSRGVTRNNESAMFAAVMRGCIDVFEKLIEIPYSSHAGQLGFNALFAAVRNGNLDIAKKIMEKRPGLTREVAVDGTTPIKMVMHFNNIYMLRVLLEHDCSLGYEMTCDGIPLLDVAAYRGHVDVARELLNHCPDTPYRLVYGLRWTCLHTAVRSGNIKFVDFILRTPQLRKLVNMQDTQGKTALHFAVQQCDPKIVTALLSHKDIDVTLADNEGRPAAWEMTSMVVKTLNWTEVNMLMLKADPGYATSIYNLQERAKQQAIDEGRKDEKSLTQTYTSNTSLVAILIATITFAAAFTLPGGYSNDAGSEGLPIMAKKFAFHAFLISDTLAMCSSFAVAFICIIARWEDYEFLIYYRSFTKKLMWFAYVATTTAFSTGLYSVLAPRIRWLGIVICSMVALLPILTKLLGEWPVLKLRLRLGKTFNSDLLDMV